MFQSHADVVDKFGGTRALAEAIGIDPLRAAHWRKRGIPSRYWPRIEEVCGLYGFGITARELMRLPARQKTLA
jgi:hypothetical protein